MKELTIEEKAKAYDRALEIAKAWYKLDNNDLSNDDLETLFPELAESEDERIRKDIIVLVKDWWDRVNKDDISTKEQMIAWLEKQGEKEKFIKKELGSIRGYREEALRRLQELEKQGEQPKEATYTHEVETGNGNIRALVTEKVQLPKFKVGDWITNGLSYPMQISSIEDGMYYTHNDTVGGDIESMDKECHLWTTQDAKDGDVLACESGWTCIFKTLVNDETFSSYCFMDKTKWFCETGSECHTLKEEFVKAYNGKIYPATKEQRGTLFAKMKDAGYEWDSEKKELKKSNSYCQEHCKGFQETGKCFADGDCKAKAEAEQKSAIWSEEDERNMQNIDSVLFYDKTLPEDTCVELRNFLKTLKQRIGG